ncbi:MAG: extensin family protein [Pontixanthobacter sp.]
MIRILSAVLLIVSLSACGALPERSDTRPPRSGSAAPVLTPSPAAQQCLAKLGQSGSRFTTVPDAYYGTGCSTLNAVTLQDVRSDTGPVGIRNLGPVACPTATSFAAWGRFAVDRAARQILGSSLVRIDTMGSYACRNVAGTSRRSAHSRAEAIDIAGFVLADGRRISVRDDWFAGTAQEREFLRIIHRSACRRFGTVLGPDYNNAHRDHFHVERGHGGAAGSGYCR